LNDQSFRAHVQSCLERIGFDRWRPRLPDCVVGNAVVSNPDVDRVVSVNIEHDLIEITNHASEPVEWDGETKQVAELLGLLARPWTWQGELISAAGIFPNEADIRSWFAFNDVRITEEQTEGGWHVTSSLSFADAHRISGPSATEADRLHALARVLLACNERRPE
jgi:hypothetical protein